jgi:hypothetical protein
MSREKRKHIEKRNKRKGVSYQNAPATMQHANETPKEEIHQKIKNNNKTKRVVCHAKSKGLEAPMPCQMREETRKERRYVTPDRLCQVLCVLNVSV